MGQCRNVGLRHATQQWTAFLDSDDEWLPGHLARVSAYVDRFLLISESAVTPPITHDGARVLGNVEPRDVELHGPFDILEPENRIVTSACVVNTRFALDVGGFADGSRSEDLDLWIRCTTFSPAIALGTVGAVYHRHDEQVSAHLEEMRDAARRYVRSYEAQDWYSAAALRRIETRHLWDELRQNIRDAQRRETVRKIGKIARRPLQAAVLLRLFRVRRTSRRRGRLEWTRALQAGKAHVVDERGIPVVVNTR